MKNQEELKKKVEEALLSTLPKMQAELTVKRLEEADRLEISLKKAEATTEDLRVVLKEKQDELLKMKSEANKVSAQAKANVEERGRLEQLKINLEAVKRGLDIEILKKELEMTKSSKDDLFRLTETVFKNRTVREEVIKSTDRSCDLNNSTDQYGNLVTKTVPNGQNDVESVIKTKTEE